MSTEPADRPRAEAAIRALYAGKGTSCAGPVGRRRRRPGWSSAAFAAQTRTWIRGTYTRGDVGSGCDRRAGTRSPSRSTSSLPGAAGSSSGSSAIRELAAAGRAASASGRRARACRARRSVRRSAAPPVAADADGRADDPAAIDRGGRRRPRRRAPRRRLDGDRRHDRDRPRPRACSSAPSSGLRPSTLADVRRPRGTPSRRCSPASSTSRRRVLAAIRDVFGDPLWRQLDEREWREVADRRPAGAGSLGRPVVGARRPRDRLGAAARGSTSTTAAGSTARDGPGRRLGGRHRASGRGTASRSSRA